MGQVDLGKVRSLISPVLDSLGLELIDLRFLTEHGRWILRVLIDHPAGVQVAHCQKVSREIETLLEIEGVIPVRYDLEVSSPGLDRPLVKESDFQRFSGKQAVIKTKEPLEGRSNYKGILGGIEEKRVTIIVDGKEFCIPYEMIQKAHLVC